MTDPIIEAAIDRAVDRLARRLALVSPLKDPEAAARAFLDELMDGPDRWRPVPLPPGHRPPGTGAPPTPEFRRVLAELHNTPREDTDTP